MTLLIAYLLIDLNHLGDGWKVWATILWVAHLLFHTSSARTKL